jgi:ABC-type dipeptide/oligopeptide/nickel transport system permease component
LQRFLIRRFLFVLLSAFAVTILVFTLSRTMGDPLLLYAREGYGRTPEQMAALERYLGLDRPLIVQYFMWLGNAMKGDLGNSLVDRRPVTRLLLERAPATIQLAIAGWVVATIVGIPLGVLSAVKRASIWDYLGRFFALFGQATPAFWFGIVAILIFSVVLGWLPTSTRPTDVPLTTQIKHFILPTMVLAWGPAAGYLRLTRSAMLEVLDSEYIKLARAKGVRGPAVVWRHAFKNALIPPVTVSVLLLAGYLNGAAVVEIIFAWPGLGRLALDSLYDNDFPLLTGSVLLITLLYLAAYFISDVIYVILDPRIRYN